jgi:3-oxoacyl-[acyl-carrier-protein] synthase II
VLSEGAAVLVLEELTAARRRGAPLLGEVTGYGCTTDAYDFTVPAPDLLARAEAVRVALARAGLEPSQIDYVNAHGTSTPLNDLNESEAIKRALGPAARTVPVSSTKSYTGHLIGAAGAIETIFCLKAIRDGLIPATRNLLDPDPACDLDYVPNDHRPARLRRVLNLSFGFGGANAALVIEEVRS